MENSFWKQAADFLKNKKNARRWMVLFLCLAVIVTAGTFAALKLNGQAMTSKSRELVCSYEVHKHTKDCYETVDGKKVLVCGYADTVVHSHNDDCYDADGKLVCTLPEVKADEHEHNADCFETDRVLTCGKEESEGHKHGDGCYKVEKTLSCGKEESEGHTHDDSCYDESGKLICEKEESEGHTHSDACYTEDKVLTCKKEESEGHTHSDACYSEEKVLTCDKLVLHTHDKDCYATADDAKDKDGDGKADGRPICGIPELEEHMHSADCFEIVETTADGSEDNGGLITMTNDDPSPVQTPANGSGNGEDGNAPDGSENDKTQDEGPVDLSDLGNFVKEVTILDSEGNKVDEKNGTLYVGEDYDITIKFEERGAQGWQFDTEDGVLTYQIPKFFKVEELQNLDVTVEIDGENVTIGKCTVDKDGKLTIQLSEDGKAALEKSNNVAIEFNMSATAQNVAGGGDGNVNFGSAGQDFNFKVTDQPRVAVEKYGEYVENEDRLGGTLKYKVETTVKHGDVHNAVIEDVLTPPQTCALKIGEVKESDVKVTLKQADSEEEIPLVKGKDYKLVPVSDSENPGKKTFRVEMLEDSEYTPLKEDDVLIVTYDYNVDYVKGSTEVFWGNVLNEVTVTGSMPVENPDKPGETTDIPFKEERGSNVEIQVTPPGDGIICKTQEFSEATHTLHYTLYTEVPAGEWTPFYIQDDMIVEFGGKRYNLLEFNKDHRVKNLTVSAVDVNGRWNDNTDDLAKIDDLKDLKKQAHVLTGYNIDRWDSAPKDYDPESVDNYIYVWLNNNLEIVFGNWISGEPSQWGSWNYGNDRLIITEYDLDMSDDLGKLKLVDISDYTTEIEKSASEVLLAGIRNIVNMRFSGYFPGYEVFFNNAEKMNKTGKLDKNTNTIDYTVTLNATDTTVNKYFQDVKDEWMDLNAADKYSWWRFEEAYSDSMQAVFYDELPEGWEYVEDSLTVTACNVWGNQSSYPYDMSNQLGRKPVTQEGDKQVIKAPLMFFYDTNNYLGIGNLFDWFNERLASLTFTYQLQATDDWLQDHAYIEKPTNIHNYAAIKDKVSTHWDAKEDISYFPARLTKTAEQEGDTNLLRFTLNVNPNGMDLDKAKDYLLVTDTSENLQIQTDSIEVLDENGKPLTRKKDASVKDPVGANEWAMVPITDEEAVTEKQHQFRLMVPDKKALQICYNALIPEKGTDVKVSNTAEIKGVDRSNTGYEGSLQVNKVYGSGSGQTYKLTVNKADSVNQTKTLPGAEFKYYIVRKEGTQLGETDSITVGKKKYSCYTEDDWKLTTDENGTCKIEDSGKWRLEAGNYYILEETRAPAGYVRPKEPILFYYGFDSDIDRVNYPGAVATSGMLTVTNEADTFELPESGGIGTTIFYVIGICLVGAAVVLLVVRRRLGKKG